MITRLSAQMKIGFASLLISVIFFGWDILADIYYHVSAEEEYSAAQIAHLLFEIIAFGALIYALKLLDAYQKLLITRAETAESAVSVYQHGADLLFAQRLDEVELSQAEKEIAVFILKGLSPAEIAELRGTAVGTVKTQTTSIYRKMRVKSRSELLAQLIDDVLDLDELERMVAATNT